MKKLFLYLYLLSGLISCKDQANLPVTSIIPEPSLVKINEGTFSINGNTIIGVDPEDPDAKRTARLFADEINALTGLHVDVTDEIRSGNIIRLELKNSERPDEAYEMSITGRRIVISASGHHGLFNGLQSLKQLIINSEKSTAEYTVPRLRISDAPRFPYRGMHLDVCRHFIPVEDVKRYLDYMALYKFNNFHWHLTEDQGWRIEIKEYPKLTEVGAWRDETVIGHMRDKPLEYDGRQYGGFYSQEEIREIVRYAKERFIRVIPEIEMPGHARAAIASYPELGVTGETIGVKKEWGISPYIFMPSEETFTFLEDVLTEVMALFPSEYIHIGGDEARKDQWEESAEVQALIDSLGLQDEDELQSWFIRRIEKFLNDHGRKIIGWDEILEGGLAPNATVMSWRGEEGGIEAAGMGHDVIMTPTGYCYFDYYQSDPEPEPLAIGGYLPIEKVYSYDPVPDALNSEDVKHILGVQANVWTEYISDFEQVEYMIFPRMLAMSEIAWTEPSRKDSVNFFRKVHDHVNIFNQLEANYSKTGMPGKGR